MCVVDGIRIDTVAEVGKDFWATYNKKAGVYAVGEVDNGDVTYACPYQTALDGILNYPTYFPLVRAFESSSGSISDLADMINSVKADCTDTNLLGSFSENHDNPRFASYTQDLALAKNVLTYTILADGIPIIYAGQEQHYDGAADPANREATWLSGYDTTSELYTWVAKMNKIRSFAIKSDDGYTTYNVNFLHKKKRIRKGYIY
jgi:alpha-amylase